MSAQSTPKSCSTCEHRSDAFCNLSGFFMKVERRFPTKCGENFEGWTPRLGLWQRIKFWWTGRITKGGEPLLDLRQEAWNKLGGQEAADKTLVDILSGTKGGAT